MDEVAGQSAPREDLLTVPLIEPDLRMNLLATPRQISLALNLEATDAAAQKEESAADAASRARRWRSSRAAWPWPSWARTTRTASGRPTCYSATDEQVWQDDLDTAGDDIGRGFQLLARNAADAADKARKAPIAEAAASLRQAALAMHFLDAGEAEVVLAIVDPADGEPPGAAARPPRLAGGADVPGLLGLGRSRQPVLPRRPGCLHPGRPRPRRRSRGAGPQGRGEEARLAVVKPVETLLRNPDDFAFRWLDGRDWKTDADKFHVTDVHNIQFQYGLIGPKGARPAGRWSGRPPGPKLVAAQNAGQPRPLERVADKPEDASVTYAVAPQHRRKDRRPPTRNRCRRPAKPRTLRSTACSAAGSAAWTRR